MELIARPCLDSNRHLATLDAPSSFGGIASGPRPGPRLARAAAFLECVLVGDFFHY